MTKRIEMVGNRYGFWTVLKHLGSNENGQTIYLCRCDCGIMRVVVAQPLRNGRTVSCGCKKADLISDAKRLHNEPYISRNGLGYTYMRPPQYHVDRDPEYRAWLSMKNRCSPDNEHVRHLYYDRGIRIHPRWHDYENFLIDMGRIPRVGLTLNRVNNDSHYEPGNCNWADPQEQAQNRRTSIDYEENIAEQREYEEYRSQPNRAKRGTKKTSPSNEDVGI